MENPAGQNQDKTIWKNVHYHSRNLTSFPLLRDEIEITFSCRRGLGVHTSYHSVTTSNDSIDSVEKLGLGLVTTDLRFTNLREEILIILRRTS